MNLTDLRHTLLRHPVTAGAPTLSAWFTARITELDRALHTLDGRRIVLVRCYGTGPTIGRLRDRLGNVLATDADRAIELVFIKQPFDSDDPADDDLVELDLVDSSGDAHAGVYALLFDSVVDPRYVELRWTFTLDGMAPGVAHRSACRLLH